MERSWAGSSIPMQKKRTSMHRVSRSRLSQRLLSREAESSRAFHLIFSLSGAVTKYRYATVSFFFKAPLRKAGLRFSIIISSGPLGCHAPTCARSHLTSPEKSMQCIFHAQ
jgi:hypothetical protein